MKQLPGPFWEPEWALSSIQVCFTVLVPQCEASEYELFLSFPILLVFIPKQLVSLPGLQVSVLGLQVSVLKFQVSILAQQVSVPEWLMLAKHLILGLDCH